MTTYRVAHRSGTRVPYTRELLERAIAMSKTMGWKEVAAELGRAQGSLEATVCMYRKGKWQPKQQAARTNRIRNEIEAIISRDKVVIANEIHARIGHDVTWHLQNMGLDAEMRRELAGERMAA